MNGSQTVALFTKINHKHSLLLFRNRNPVDTHKTIFDSRTFLFKKIKDIMKTTNLVIAIIYTAILSLVALTATDSDTIIGVIMLAPPVIVNWMSWNHLK